jgi:hypothetical protein
MPKNQLSLPKPPKLWQSLGPSFIMLGLALGSGELIMWPYLTASWGFGLMWGALLGITFQFFLNTEVMRYSLAWGESVFVGFAKIFKWAPYWFILSTFIPWGLPGFSSATAQIITRTLGFGNQTALAIGLLFLVGIILTAGKVLYKTMEYLQKTIIIIGLPVIIGLVVYFSRAEYWAELLRGFAGQGQGWWFFPAGVSVASFLGAFAYSGAGGNLNLAQSYYIKEKGFGMGRYTGKITSLFSPGKKEIKLEGQTFALDKSNLKLWQKWWRLVNQEHFLVFWGLGLLTIILLSFLSRVLLLGSVNQEGIEFLFQQANVIKQQLSPFFALVFISIAGVMLYSTQLGVLESASRIISENFLLIIHRPGRSVNASLAFYIALWGQISLGIITLLLGIKEPRFLLTLSALLNAIAMMVAFLAIYLLNRQRLPKALQPSKFRVLVLFAAFLFFLIFVLYLALWPNQ